MMNRRKFLTRLAQIAGGAALVTHFPPSGGLAAAGTEATTKPIDAAAIAEVEARLVEFWQTYAAKPSVVVVSADYYSELARLSGLPMDELGIDRRFMVGAVQIIRDRWLPDGSAYRLRPELFKLAPPRHIIEVGTLTDDEEAIPEVNATPEAESQNAAGQ